METFGKFAKAHSTSFRSDEHELPVAISVYYKLQIQNYRLLHLRTRLPNVSILTGIISGNFALWEGQCL